MTSLRKTISVRELVRRNHLTVIQDDESGPLPTRPQTRGECIDGPRPCPWVGCRHNAYLDVNKRTGSLKVNFPGLEPEDMDPKRSCVLDIADGGEVTLEEAGDVLNLTRERSRQLEYDAMATLHMRAFRDEGFTSILRDHAADPDPNRKPHASGHARRFLEAVAEPFEEEPETGESLPFVSFFARDDEAVCNSVWAMLSKLWRIRSKGSLAISAYRRRVAKEGR